MSKSIFSGVQGAFLSSKEKIIKKEERRRSSVQATISKEKKKEKERAAPVREETAEERAKREEGEAAAQSVRDLVAAQNAKRQALHRKHKPRAGAALKGAMVGISKCTIAGTLGTCGLNLVAAAVIGGTTSAGACVWGVGCGACGVGLFMLWYTLAGGCGCCRMPYGGGAAACLGDTSLSSLSL